MANKKISELESRASLSLSDLMAVGDPSTGYLYKTTISDLKTLTGAGVVSFNGRFGTVNPAEGDYTLTQLGDVIITSPSNGQVLKYNGSNWVNASDVTEADTLDTVTTRGNTTANSITVGSVTAAGLSNLLGQIRTFATTGNTYIGANPGSATDAGFKLDVLGTTRLNGNTTVTGVLTGSDTIRSTNGTVTVSLSYGSTAGIIGTTSNHSLEIRTNNTYRVGVSTAGVVNIANLIGTGSRMVVADSAGNLSTQAIPDLSGYLPLSGGTLTGGLIGTTGSFASSGSGDTFAINHSSGSGIALNITKGGNGEGLYINKTGGSGNAATFIGTLNATTLVKSGGTSSQFLKADGSVDSNTYATDSSVVHISGTETITGAKTFSNVTTFNQNIVGGIIKLGQGVLLSKSAAIGTDPGYLSLIATSATGLNYINIADGDNFAYYQRFAVPNTGNYTYTFPAASGTIALTSDIPSVAGVYLPLSGGTLTGALNGTSASFSSSVTANILNSTSTGSTQIFLKTTGGGSNRDWQLQTNEAAAGDFSIMQSTTAGGGTYVTKFNISPTGAATFSSSVTATALGLNASAGTNAAKLFVAGTSSLYDSAGTRGVSFFMNRSGVNVITSDYIGTSYLPISLSARDNNGDLYLTTDGKIGIGTTTPLFKLDVQTNTSNDWAARIYNGSATNPQGLLVQTAATSAYNAFSVVIADVNRLVVSGSGNVGIGTSAPNGLLEVKGGNIILNSTSAGNHVFSFALNGTEVGQIYHGSDNINFYAGTGNYLRFSAGANERARITAGGNFGINTTNPTEKLDVVGTIKATQLSLGDSYSNTVTTDSSWSSFQTIIPTATLDVFTVYLITASYAVSGAPYNVVTSFTFVVPNGNGGGTDNEFTPICTTHQGGTGTMSFRAVAGSSQNACGLQVKFNGFSTLTGTLILRATILKRAIN